jgi:polysaccharide transporter, PST family
VLLKEGTPFFLSSVMVTLYTISCGFLLGMYTDPTRVAFYTAAAKVVVVSQAVFVMPISRIVFPVIGNTLRADFGKGIEQIRKVQTVLIALGGGTAVALFFGADIIISFLFGAEYRSSIPVLRIMAIVPLAIGLSNLFGIQGLINMGYDRWLFRATIVGAIVGLASSMALTPVYRELGAAGALVIAECVMGVLTYALYVKARLRGAAQKVHIP